MRRILVRVERLRKGVGGRTLLAVEEGSFRKHPDVMLPPSHAPFRARQVQNLLRVLAQKISKESSKKHPIFILLVR
jgi:hypothetical protein